MIQHITPLFRNIVQNIAAEFVAAGEQRFVFENAVAQGDGNPFPRPCRNGGIR